MNRLMRFLFVLLSFVIVQNVAFAQPPVLPSSKNAAQQKKIDSLNDLSYKIYLEYPDSARAIAEKALLLAERSRYQLGIGRGFMNIGHVYWAQSYYPVALFYLNKALAELPKDQQSVICNAYIIRGRIYTDLHNYGEAIKNLDRARQFAMDDPDCVAGILSERSLVYKRTGRYAEAIRDAKKALVLNKIAHNKDDEAVLYGKLSGTYRLTRDFKAAVAYSDTALRESYTTRNKRLRATTYVEYAQIYYQMHDYDKAIAYANLGGDLADSIGVVDAISQAYKTLIGSYESKHKLQKAMFYQERYNKMQDSVNSFNRKKNTDLIQNYFTLNTKLNEMAVGERNQAELRDKMKWQNAVITSLSLSLIAVILMLAVTYYFYRQKKLAGEHLNLQNEALTSQKQVIEAQTANLETLSNIKNKLLAVIAHDLRTPLANLRNIADMFETDYLTKEEVHWLMKDINPMVKGAELTLSNLLEWAGNQMKGQSISLAQLDISLLGVEMEQTFMHTLQKKGIGFANTASPGKSVMADENHIKVVLRNLISNAIKFTDNNGSITLASEFDDNKVIISVKDTGKGMTREETDKLFSAQTHFSQRGTSGENGLGIGLMLCKELVELNGGKLWVVSTPGKGSTFYFSLPLNAEYA
jgi:signal transduction histidine kinase